MTTNKIQAEFKRERLCIYLIGCMAPDRSQKWEIYSFSSLNFNDPILLKLVLLLIINRIQVAFEKRDFASICSEVTTHDRHEKCNFLVPLNNFSLIVWISLKLIWYLAINEIYRWSLKTEST